MIFSMIVAICDNNGIGRNNELVWHITEDLQHFSRTTNGHIVVMGANTYLSIPEKKRPLKNRMNVVVTHNPQKYIKLQGQHDNLIFTTLEDLETVINTCEKLYGYSKVFICGGESIYRQFLEKVGYLYVTKIFKHYECDRFFPHFEHLFNLKEKSTRIEAGTTPFGPIAEMNIFSPVFRSDIRVEMNTASGLMININIQTKMTPSKPMTVI